MTSAIGKLRRVPLREVWPNEAHDFTKWLERNIDVLSEALGVQLSPPERERLVGSFSVDLVTEANGQTVIVENQLERSDHDHLGKLITYLTALDAKGAVWIVADPRPEHVGAVTWLNESSAASFFLVKIEAIRVGDSDAAPLFTLIAGPSPETDDIRNVKTELAERQVLRRRFWAELLGRANERTNLHSAVSPTPDSWISAGAGRTGLSYVYRTRQSDGAVELYIDFGKGRESETRDFFKKLHLDRAAIESAFGGPMYWDEDEGRRARKIGANLTVGGYRSPDEQWPEIHTAMVSAMQRLDEALRPYL